jgi:hypothetical protein
VLLDNHSNIPTMGTSRCTISHRDFFFSFLLWNSYSISSLLAWLISCCQRFCSTTHSRRCHLEHFKKDWGTWIAKEQRKVYHGRWHGLWDYSQTQLWKKDFLKLSGTIQSCLYKKTNLRRIFHRTASASSSSCSR